MPRNVGRSSISFCLMAFLVMSAAFFLDSVPTGLPTAAAQPAVTWPQIKLLPVAGGFSEPTQITHAGDGSGRIFVLEREGLVKIIRNGAVLPTPFLDLTDRVLSSGGGEQGLLSIAFPSNFATKKYFYASYTKAVPGDTLTGVSIISRIHLSATPDVADPATEQVLLTIDQPDTNHNGGQLGFSPIDGYLYIGMGDGGSGNDPNNHAQRLDSQPGNKMLLGKLLRIDVESGVSPYAIPPTNPVLAASRNEIWSIGLRNPWKFAFDRTTGDLYIGDVGQNQREEIDFQPATSTGAVNYGWRILEGTRCTGLDPALCASPGLTGPVAEYDHSQGCSITGGFVYRGTIFSDMQGIYFYADFCSGRIWGLKHDGASWQSSLLIDTTIMVSTFGEDDLGNLYVADFAAGQIYAIAGSAPIVANLPEAWQFAWYDNAGIDTTIQKGNQTASPVTCLTSVGGVLRGIHLLSPNGAAGGEYANLLDGPVKIDCTNKIVASQRGFFGSSFNEVMGVLTNQLDREWWLPWYDNSGMQTWLLIANLSNTNTSAACTVTIGGIVRGQHTISAGGRIFPQYNLLTGPLKVNCDNPVLVSERSLFSGSFNETLAVPASQFDRQWWFPWYDNVAMHAWLMMGNPSGGNTTATCNVSIGGTPRGQFAIGAGSITFNKFPDLLDGPMKVDCDIPIYATQRVTYNSSFNEVAGIPGAQLNRVWWLPFYDNIDMQTWLLIANPASASTNATCTVFIAGTARGQYVISAGGRIFPQYNLKDGPVKVDCDNSVLVSERSLFSGSFNEITAAPPH